VNKIRPQNNGQPALKVGKSKTAYPYNDLDQSIAVAKAIQDKAGGLCGTDHLAEYLGYSSARSGTFFSRVQAAKMFGLVQSQGEYLAPTERAHSILCPVMQGDEARARLDGFLNIPLFSDIFEQFKGQSLPPDIGIKNLLKTKFGIVEDRVGPAMRILMDSAEQAGLFKTTGDRSKMIKPVMGSPEAKEIPKLTGVATPPVDKPKGGVAGWGGGGGDPPIGIHSAIGGLLRELPPPGTEWPSAKKGRFLSAFKAIIDVVYPDAEETP